MKKSRIQTAGALAVCLVLFLTGCNRSDANRPLLWYADSRFPLEMTLYAPDGASETEYILSGERAPDSVVLTVTHPTTLRGLTVRYVGGNCTLAAGETVVPLSPAAAVGLTTLFDALLVSSVEDAELGSDAEGRTTVAYEEFVLTLDENGLPEKIRAADGREALVRATAPQSQD